MRDIQRTETKQDNLGRFKIYILQGLEDWLWGTSFGRGWEGSAIYSKPSWRTPGWNLRRGVPPSLCCSLWHSLLRQNMTFLEASWLGGICATAYPADCSWCHTPLAFYKTPSLSPCGPLHTAVIVHPGDGAGKHTMQSIHPSLELSVLR